ncbi:MAG: hypothetical protein CM1200mP20_16310 [Pseudomonadota bacterium]|nr:MAG: hypothetical protein CM1200mP20_16310 [Pseudomonadota bacterium]
MGLAVLEELSGIKTDIDDPLLEVFESIGGQALQPHQDAVIEEAETLLKPAFFKPDRITRGFPGCQVSSGGFACSRVRL